MASGASLRVVDISHRFTTPGGTVNALHQIAFQITPGEFVALVGPSGCGKTTLLRIAAGLVEPDQGRVLLDGEPLDGPAPGVGVVFQKPTLLPWRSVEENIALPLQIAGESTDDERVGRWIAAVGLEGFESARPAELSGGMQQRVALARALVTEPRLLLMDEPFGALDMMLRSEMNELLLALWERARPTVLFVTHDLHEAVYLADRVIGMGPRPGHIVGTFAIELPRPRASLARYGREVQEYVEPIWRLLDGTPRTRPE